MGVPNNKMGQAPELHVASWKAMPMFAVAGGLMAGIHLLAGIIIGDHSEQGAMFLAFHSVGVLPWALAGALYARLANRSGQDLANHRTRSRLGAKAGAITSVAAWFLVGLIASPWLWAHIPGALLLSVVPAVLAAAALVGALQGALTAVIVGRFTMEPLVADRRST